MSWRNPFANTTSPNTNEPECMTHYNAALRKIQFGQVEEGYNGLLYSIKIDVSVFFIVYCILFFLIDINW